MKSSFRKHRNGMIRLQLASDAKKSVKKAAKQKSPKHLHIYHPNGGRRACTKDSKYKGFYSGM